MCSTSSISFKTNFFEVYIDLFFFKVTQVSFLPAPWSLVLLLCYSGTWRLLRYFVWTVVIGRLVNNSEAGRLGCQVITSWVLSVCVFVCYTIQILLCASVHHLQVIQGFIDECGNIACVRWREGGLLGCLTCLVAALLWGLLLSEFCTFSSAKCTCSDRPCC